MQNFTVLFFPLYTLLECYSNNICDLEKVQVSFVKKFIILCPSISECRRFYCISNFDLTSSELLLILVQHPFFDEI